MPWHTLAFVAFLAAAGVAFYLKKPMEGCALLGVAFLVGP